MAGESTNRPTGPGSNPGGVPINDQGAAMPNPAPPPPSSLPPQKTGIENVAEQMAKMGKETEEALKALEEFKRRQDEVNKVVEKSAKSHEQQQKLDKEHQDAILNRRKAEETAQQETKELAQQYAQYRDRQGNWMKGSEPIQRLWISQIAEVGKKRREALAAETAARDAVQAHAKTMRMEAREREKAIGELRIMEDLRDDIMDVDEAFKNELDPAFDALKKSLVEAGSKIGEYEKTRSESLEKKLKEIAEEARKKELQDKAKEASERIAQMRAATKEERDEKRRRIQLLREDMKKDQDAEEIRGLASAGGLAGATDIKKYLDELVEAQREQIKRANPNAGERYIANKIDQMLKGQSANALIERKIQQKFNEERIAAERKVVESIMSEKKVSEKMAVAMMREQSTQKDTEIYKELKSINEKQQAQVDGLRNMTDGQKQALARADQDAADRLEDASEMKNLDPSKAVFGMGEKIALGINKMRGELSGIFKKDDGWFKTIALVLTMVVGGILGYIWLKIKFIADLLTMLPGRLGGFFKGIFSGIGGGAKGIFGAISSPFKALKGFLEPILKFFPGISSSLGQFGKAFSFGFRILGKVFFWVGLTIDVIMGAYKGFKELGNIKGLLMGAVAGIISFFTFGLIDFKTIFDTLGKYFGMFFDALSGIVDVFIWVFKPLWDSIKKIIAIFQGTGSIMGKIFGSLWELIKGVFMTVVRYAIAFLIRIPIMIYKAIWGLVTGTIKLIWDLLNWTIEKIAEGIIFIYDWFATGQWLGDLAKLGEWLWTEMTSLFTGIMDSVADAMGDIPFIGSAIKGFLGGGSEDKEEELKTTIEKASETTEKMVTESKATKEVLLDVPKEVAAHQLAGEVAPPIAFAPEAAVSIPVTTPAGAQLAQASAQVNAAQIAAGKSTGQTTAISAPTTNVVGGGGDSAVIMPSTSRNNDPTFRALLFLESPAL